MPRATRAVLDQGRARRIKLVVLDVDGVLTDNTLFIGRQDGGVVELKQFNVQDGLGLHLLRLAAIPVAWLSGRVSPATSARASGLGIADVIQDGAVRKLEALTALANRRQVTFDEILFVGDDLADVPVLRRVGLPVSVANGVPEARERAAYVTARSGGHGAVREVVEVLLKARGEWEDTLDRYYRERGDVTD